MNYLTIASALSLLSVMISFGQVQTNSEGKMMICVVDYLGEAISNASLRVTDTHNSRSVRTSNDGCATVNGLQRGTVELVVSAAGFRQESRSVIFEGEDLRLDFGLQVGGITDPPGITVSGIVTANGAPVPGAVVTVVNAFSDRSTQRAISDKSGRYRIELRYAGQYIIYAFRGGYKISTSDLYLEAAVNHQNFMKDFQLIAIRKQS